MVVIINVVTRGCGEVVVVVVLKTCRAHKKHFLCIILFRTLCRTPLVQILMPPHCSFPQAAGSPTWVHPAGVLLRPGCCCVLPHFGIPLVLVLPA